jgi:glycosyltransferase involved in cell wall biosynthesis
MSNVGDIEDMSTHAIELLKNDDMLAEFKKNAYAQAQKFDIQNIVPKYEQLYNRFCKCL